jgi:hypothetical protein
MKINRAPLSEFIFDIELFRDIEISQITFPDCGAREVRVDKHVMPHMKYTESKALLLPCTLHSLCLHTCSPRVCINYLILFLIERSIIVQDEYHTRNLPLKNLLTKGNREYRTVMLFLLVAHMGIRCEYRTDYNFV